MLSKHLEPLPDHRSSNVQAYVAGFALSVALSAGAFVLVWAYRTADGGLLNRGVMLAALAVLAVTQLFVQALFFLHLSAERRARLTLYSGLFTVMVVLTIVVGSLWIMQNLNYNMMTKATTQYIQQEENIHNQ